MAELSFLKQTGSKCGAIHFEKESQKAAICAIFNQMEKVSLMFEGRRDRSAKEETMLCALLTQLLLLLSLEESDIAEYSDKNLMHEVMEYLNRHLFDELSLDKISQRFFVSKYYLCRAFKEYAGVSLLSYVNAKRIVMADQLIARGETATEAAYTVGFGSYSSFYRAYVKQNGHPPVRENHKIKE